MIVRLFSRLGLAVLVLGLALSGTADAQSTVVHEHVPPDPNEDVSFSATTLDGDLPAAIRTPSGVATAPDPQRPPGDDHIYSGATTDDSPDATYEPDRDTRRPNIENYDDPFSPATAPFKRLRAYDWVEADYSLHVRDKTLKKIEAGGSATAQDEPFYGDMTVDLIADQPVRIPTVGPSVRLLRVHANPEVPVTLFRDGADNWFARGADRARVRLVVELAVVRATFGSEFADVDWRTLEAGQPVWRIHEAEAAEVMRSIGVSRAMRPRQVVEKLVTYFRSFVPSEDAPTGRGDIYLDLALSKKGVCRHRAFAFLVTALAMGIPTRMVVNEAHAWVEVFDGSLWHRIDLGGAAANLDHQPESTRPPYRPPPDPYDWPEGRDSSGQSLAERTRESANGPRNASNSSNADAADGGAPSPSPDRSNDPTSEPNDPSARRSQVKVTAIDSDVRRGYPLHIQGEIASDGASCPHLRVDVSLVSEKMPQGAPAGSLSTDERGVFDGAVVIPRDLGLGDYELVVSTPGDARCPGGRAK